MAREWRQSEWALRGEDVSNASFVLLCRSEKEDAEEEEDEAAEWSRFRCLRKESSGNVIREKRWGGLRRGEMGERIRERKRDVRVRDGEGDEQEGIIRVRGAREPRCKTFTVRAHLWPPQKLPTSDGQYLIDATKRVLPSTILAAAIYSPVKIKNFPQSLGANGSMFLATDIAKAAGKSSLKITL
ncbi:hypothetical protein AAC387_Pa10g0547 [Persea americana]